MKAILFDLDATLLPMDQDLFIKEYFASLNRFFIRNKGTSQLALQAVMEGTQRMLMNQGDKTNEEVFWEAYSSILGKEAASDKALLEKFYENEFDELKQFCHKENQVKALIQNLKQKNKILIIASNPVFPLVAQKKRMQWAGVSPQDFAYITSYENSKYCKPKLKYYEEILIQFHLKAEDCLMVGNDVSEDMVSKELGIDVFLITDHLINRNKEDITLYPHGNFEQLLRYIEVKEKSDKITKNN